jgi:hypothetical protein
MRKLALLLAAGLLVGAPLTAAVTTDTYAAAKKAKKAGKGPAAAKETSPDEANSRFARALGDLANSLGTYVYVPGDVGGGDKGGKKGKKSGGKKGKKSA